MNIGQKIDKIQERLRITQSELAKKLGVSFVTINRWKGEKAFPRKKHLESLEDLYLEVVGRKIISQEELDKDKSLIISRLNKRHVLDDILQNKDILDQFVLDLTYNTNRIEGSTMTEKDTASVIFDNIALPDKSLTEQLEAKNHKTALFYMFDYVSSKGEINEEFVIKLHAILMNSIQPDAGMYRNHPVRIVGTNVPTANYLKIPELIEGLLREIEDIKDSFYKTSVFHSRFEKIHPFSDGNGRVGRLLMNAVLLKDNVAPAVIEDIRKQLYYTYLQKSQLKEDYSQLEKFIIESVNKGIDILDRK